jgi:uncharacterized phage infection (PIP) family protein YhgE
MAGAAPPALSRDSDWVLDKAEHFTGLLVSSIQEDLTQAKARLEAAMAELQQAQAHYSFLADKLAKANAAKDLWRDF